MSAGMSTQLAVSTAITPRFIHGAVEVERTAAGLLPHRLPAWARAQCADPQLAMAQSQPSGVRLVFRTTATELELVVLPTKRVYGSMAARADGIYDLLVDGRLLRQASVRGGQAMKIDMASGATTLVPGEARSLRFGELPGGFKHVEIWLPHDETTELLALRSSAPVFVVTEAGRKRWVHHGSSISQGSNAAHPSGIWPAVAAARAGLDLLNLGFGGSALLDPFVARSIRDLPADLISLKIGINLVNTDLMRLRAFAPAVHGFLDTIRDGHPDTPLYLVSPLCCPMHEEVPGPTQFDTGALAAGRVMFRAGGSVHELAQGKLNLRLIREGLAAIVRQRAASDPQLHYVDGLALYGHEDSARMALRDELHPDADSHRLIGERFADLVLAGS